MTSLLTLHLTTSTILGIVSTAVQQSVITEPISRLLEMLLYGKRDLRLILTFASSRNLFDCRPSTTYVWTVANKEISVKKVG
jgi:transcriptional regulator CtsR